MQRTEKSKSSEEPRKIKQKYNNLYKKKYNTINCNAKRLAKKSKHN